MMDFVQNLQPVIHNGSCKLQKADWQKTCFKALLPPFARRLLPVRFPESRAAGATERRKHVIPSDKECRRPPASQGT